MTKEELSSIIFGKTGKLISKRLKTLYDDYPILNDILGKYKIDELGYKELPKRIYLFLNDMEVEPHCKSCNRIPRFISFQKGYKGYCKDPKCSLTVKGDSNKSSITKKNNIENENKEFYEEYIRGAHEKIPLDVIKNFIVKRDIDTYSGFNNQWVNRKVKRDNKYILYNILDITSKTLSIKKDDYEWSKRFFNIMNDINKTQLCYCGKELTYNNYKKGYSSVCNDCKSLESGKNRIVSHYKNNVKPSVIEQGFKILNEDVLLLEGINKKNAKLNCSKCNKDIYIDLSNGRSTNIYCTGCYGNIGKSKEEDDFLKYIKSIYDGEIIEQYKFHKNKNSYKRYDIYIPEFNIALEYDGIYYHSTNSTIKCNKHYERNNLSEEIGINCFHIISNEWNSSQRFKWEYILRNNLGLNENKIFARKCSIREISSKDKDLFLDKYHFQGKDKSKIKIGLFYNDELVSVMTFGNPRFNKKYQWELIRLCSKGNTTIIGGASKMLKYFERKYNPSSILSYSDRRRSSGNIYNVLGFNLLNVSNPNYFYYKNNNFLSRYECQKHKLSNILYNFDKKKTEKENMIDNGYRIYYDCGNKVWIKTY